MNENIIKEFQKLVYQIKVDIRKKNNPIDKYRLGSVQNVLRLLKQIDFRITDSDELKGIKGIGKKSLDRVQEILDTGKLSEININTKKEFIKNEIIKIFGIGNQSIDEIIKKHKIKSVDDFIKKVKSKKIKVNDQVKLGVKYYKHSIKKIPRSEITEGKTKLKKILKGFYVEICGSYRRKKKESNDIDVLVYHPKKSLSDVIELLYKHKFLLDDLTENSNTKYMGYCKIKKTPRRIDIRMVTKEQIPYALLYFTGSKNFNKHMRQVAKAQGYKLNEYGLYKNNKLIKLKSERQIFRKLGLRYTPPKDRE